MEIKDSGTRRAFNTGAVRDIQEGKGRCDLMPVGVISYFLGDNILHYIGKFINTGKSENLIEVLNLFAKEFGGPYSMFLEVSIHFEQGAKKYGENNWQKGIPVQCYIDSAIRHYLKYERGDKDEPHDRAFVWNILCAIWTIDNMPELNSYSKEKTVE